MNKTETIISLAKEIAEIDKNFQKIQGAGDGNRATNIFMQKLRSRIVEKLNNDYSEKRISGDNSFAVDFYIQEENTIVEVALGLPNPASEFEKDILKAIMAKELGADIQKLVFISRAGAEKKCLQPGRKAIRNWAEKMHGLKIEIFELPGEIRKRGKLLKS